MSEDRRKHSGWPVPEHEKQQAEAPPSKKKPKPVDEKPDE